MCDASRILSLMFFIFSVAFLFSASALRLDDDGQDATVLHGKDSSGGEPPSSLLQGTSSIEEETVFNSMQAAQREHAATGADLDMYNSLIRNSREEPETELQAQAAAVEQARSVGSVPQAESNGQEEVILQAEEKQAPQQQQKQAAEEQTAAQATAEKAAAAEQEEEATAADQTATAEEEANEEEQAATTEAPATATAEEEQPAATKVATSKQKVDKLEPVVKKHCEKAREAHLRGLEHDADAHLHSLEHDTVQQPQQQQQQQQQQQKHSQKRQKIPARACSGWSPSAGSFKGKGASCQRWGWLVSWCYVDKTYEGPGSDRLQESATFAGKFYGSCTRRSAVSPAAAKAASLVQERREWPLLQKLGGVLDGVLGNNDEDDDTMPPAAAAAIGTGAATAAAPATAATAATADPTTAAPAAATAAPTAVTDEATACTDIACTTPQDPSLRVIKRTEKENGVEPYDCTDGLDNWEADWATCKKVWCCENKELGCKTKQFIKLAKKSCLAESVEEGFTLEMCQDKCAELNCTYFGRPEGLGPKNVGACWTTTADAVAPASASADWVDDCEDEVYSASLEKQSKPGCFKSSEGAVEAAGLTLQMCTDRCIARGCAFFSRPAGLTDDAPGTCLTTTSGLPTHQSSQGQSSCDQDVYQRASDAAEHVKEEAQTVAAQKAAEAKADTSKAQKAAIEAAADQQVEEQAQQALDVAAAHSKKDMQAAGKAQHAMSKATHDMEASVKLTQQAKRKVHKVTGLVQKERVLQAEAARQKAEAARQKDLAEEQKDLAEEKFARDSEGLAAAEEQGVEAEREEEEAEETEKKAEEQLVESKTEEEQDLSVAAKDSAAEKVAEKKQASEEKVAKAMAAKEAQEEEDAHAAKALAAEEEEVAKRAENLEHQAQPKPFDCKSQKLSRKGWSDAKKTYCCEAEQIGCPRIAAVPVQARGGASEAVLAEKEALGQQDEQDTSSDIEANVQASAIRAVRKVEQEADEALNEVKVLERREEDDATSEQAAAEEADSLLEDEDQENAATHASPSRSHWWTNLVPWSR